MTRSRSWRRTTTGPSPVSSGGDNGGRKAPTLPERALTARVTRWQDWQVATEQRLQPLMCEQCEVAPAVTCMGLAKPGHVRRIDRELTVCKACRDQLLPLLFDTWRKVLVDV